MRTGPNYGEQHIGYKFNLVSENLAYFKCESDLESQSITELKDYR
jgi:hypothetical protein